MIVDSPVPTIESAPTLTERSMRGGTWLIARQLSLNFSRLFAIAVIARQVSPADFGLVALANVLLLFLTLVADGGVGTYLVRYTGPNWLVHARAVFWFNMALTCLQVLVAAAFLPFSGRIFNEPQLPMVFGAIVIIFVIRQASIIQESILRRKLSHRTIAVRDIVTVNLSFALGVVLALQGFGVWSLVLPGLVMEPIRAVAVTYAARWLPGTRLYTSEWPHIFRYTRHLMASNILSVFINDGDTLLVGRLLGGAVLGAYSLAWQLANLVGRVFTSVVNDLSLPALSEVNRASGSLRDVYGRLVRMTAFVSLPLSAVLFASAPDLVELLYGSRYAAVVPILRVFALYTAVRGFTSSTATVFNVVDRPDLSMRSNLLMVPFYLAAIALGSRWEAIGIAAGVTIVRTVGAMIVQAVAMRVVGLEARMTFRLVGPIAIAALLSGGAFAGVRALVTDELPLFGMMAVATAAAGVVYLTVVCAVDRSTVVEARQLLSSALRRAPKPCAALRKGAN
jgi:PST family polysaccharide transporter